MKRFLIFVIISTIGLMGYAQKPLELSAVISNDSLDANALYEATRNWFVESFKDSKSVIEDDNPGKQITGKGTMPFNANVFYSSLNGFIEFLIDVRFKDGRLKLTLRNFNHVAGPAALYNNNMGILVDELPKNLSELGLKGQRKVSYRYYFNHATKLCEETFDKMVESLADFLDNRTMQAEEDW